MMATPLPALSFPPLQNLNHFLGCRLLYFSANRWIGIGTVASSVERVPAPPTPAVSVTTSAPDDAGLGR
jgi:hypothetical protein